MLGLTDYALWLLSFSAEVYILARALIRKEFLRYLSLNLFVLVLACDCVGRYLVLRAYGFQSLEYRYFYYYTDSLISLIVYVAIIGLYRHVFEEMHVSKYIRTLAAVILGLTACCSYLVVHQNANRLTERFAFELGQNLYFVGVVLTYVLWAAMLKLRETRLRVIQLVLSFGLYFSLQAATYGLRYMFPSVEFFRLLPAWLGTWLPLSWAYTFTKVPEDARIAPARVARIRMWPSP